MKPRRPVHLCHAVGCPIAVPPRLLMCRRHWYSLPRDLRDAIWGTYRPGQEVDKNPSAAYVLAQMRAVNYVAVREGHMTSAEATARAMRAQRLADAEARRLAPTAAAEEGGAS